MTAGQAGVQQGMVVIGTDGHTVGNVKEVRDRDFVLNRRLARDLCVPFDAVRDVEAGQVVLNMSAEDVNYQRWECTKLF